MARIDDALAAGRHPLSLSHLTALDISHCGLVDAALEGGYDAVGLRVLPPRGTSLVEELVGNEPAIRQIEAAFNLTGLALYDAESFSLRAETNIVLDYGAALDVVARLGGRAILTSIVDAEDGLAQELFVTLCEQARMRGIKVGLEYISFRALKKLEDAVDFVTRAGQPNSGVIVDFLHHSRVGGTAADLAKTDPSLFAYAQICDAVANIPADDEGLLVEARTGRLVPGEGAIPLEEYLAALPADLPIGVEAPVSALAGHSAGARAKILAEATRNLLANRANAN